MSVEDAETPKIIEIAEGIWVRQEIDNIGWIDLGDCGLVVDALEHAEKEAEVFSAIGRTLGDKPVRYLLNTHTHYDHVALNEAFSRRFGTQIINLKTARIAPEGLWLEGRTRRVLMLPLAGCHTSEDCVVWSERDKALFVGDIFGWGLIPLINSLRPETRKLLLDTYARLIEFDPDVVIPGHGPLAGVAELKRWVEYLDWLIEQISSAVSAGKSDPQILQEVAPPADMRDWWRFVAWKHADSVSKVIRSVRRGFL